MTREEARLELQTELKHLFGKPPSLDDIYTLTPRGMDELWDKLITERLARREAEERVKKLEEFIGNWENWCNAYPEDIFTPFTEEELKANSILITRASAAMGRHILETMKDDICALKEEKQP